MSEGGDAAPFEQETAGSLHFDDSTELGARIRTVNLLNAVNALFLVFRIPKNYDSSVSSRMEIVLFL